MLRLVRAHATRLLISPIALLGALLVEHAGSVSHNWMLPPRSGNDTGGSGSPLTLFAAIVAMPGAGKSEAIKQAAHIVQHHDHDDDTTTRIPDYVGDDIHRPVQVEGAPVSGEALAESLIATITVPAEVDGEPGVKRRIAARHRAKYYYPELDQLLAAGSRQGSTLAPMVRAAWSGDALATTTASLERNRLIPAGTYTMGIIAAAQITNAATLLASDQTGDAQRWLWLPAHTPADPAAEADLAALLGEHPAGLPRLHLAHWPLPPVPTMMRTLVSYERSCEVQVAAEISADIVASARIALHGCRPSDITAGQADRLAVERARTGESTNQHATQMRLRIAAGVARLCGLPPVVTSDLWGWAGAVLSVDRLTRLLLADLAQAARDTQAQVARRDLQSDTVTVEQAKAYAREQLTLARARAADTAVLHA